MKIPDKWEQIFLNAKIEIAINDKDKWIESEGPVTISYDKNNVLLI